MKQGQKDAMVTISFTSSLFYLAKSSAGFRAKKLKKLRDSTLELI